MADASAIFPPLTIPETEQQRAGQKWEVGKYLFRADFDSANLHSVEQGGSSNEFHLWTKKDCQGTQHERGTRSWFFFAVSGHQAGDVVLLQVMNLNNQGRLYKNDYRPWCWSTAHTEWQPTPNKVSYKREGDNFQLRFTYKFHGPEETFFAFAIPFSYHDTQVLLRHLCYMHEQYQAIPTELVMHTSTESVPSASTSAVEPTPAPADQTSTGTALQVEGGPGSIEACADSSQADSNSSRESGSMHIELQPQGSEEQGPLLNPPSTQSSVRQSSSTPQNRPRWGGMRPLSARCGSNHTRRLQPQAITATCAAPRPSSARDSVDAPADQHTRLYFHHQVLAHSSEGRCVDLITITDCFGASDQTESAFMSATGPPQGCLSCEEGADNGSCHYAPQSAAAVHFPGKKAFFISARVHAGETPATHMLNGMLAFLLRKDDARARMLRRLYVFKLVPCVNPDGVFWGHYRADIHGQNLNRHYTNPCKVQHPSVWAIKKQLLFYTAQGTLDFYLDLHAHANKKGVFIYGNTLTGDAALASLVYARLVSLNSPVFDFQACNFTEKNMTRADKDGQSKEGAARVALFKEVQGDPNCSCQCTHFYTVEASYNTARLLNPVATACGDPDRCTTPPLARQRAPSKFTSSVLHGAGRALLVAALDLHDRNPHSRLPNSAHRSLQGVASWLCTVVRSPSDTHSMHLPPLSDACVASLRTLNNSFSALPPNDPIFITSRHCSDSNIRTAVRSHASQHAAPASSASAKRAGIGCMGDSTRVNRPPITVPAVVDMNQASALRGQHVPQDGLRPLQARFARSQGTRVLRASATDIGGMADAQQLQSRHSAPAAAAAATGDASRGNACTALAASTGTGTPPASPQSLARPTRLPKVQGSSGTCRIPTLNGMSAALGRSTSLPARSSILTGEASSTATTQPVGSRKASGIPKPPWPTTPAAAVTPAALATVESTQRPRSLGSSSTSRHASASGSTDNDASSHTLSTRLAPITRTSASGRGTPCMPVAELNIRLSEPLEAPADIMHGQLKRASSGHSNTVVLTPPQVDNAWKGHSTANAAALVLACGPWQQKGGSSLASTPACAPAPSAASPGHLPGSGRLHSRLMAALQHQLPAATDSTSTTAAAATDTTPATTITSTAYQPVDLLRKHALIQDGTHINTVQAGLCSPTDAVSKQASHGIPPYLGLQVISKPPTLKLGAAAGT